MNRNPNPENPGGRTKSARKRALADSRSDRRSAPEPGDFGPTTFSHMNEVSITKAEILRATEAIRQAGCGDVVIISTHEYVRFILTVKLPKPREEFIYENQSNTSNAVSRSRGQCPCAFGVAISAKSSTTG